MKSGKTSFVEDKAKFRACGQNTKLLHRMFLMGASLLLVACGEKPQPAQPPAPQVDPLFQQQREALGKARGVEQGMAKSAEEQKREAEKQAQ